MVAFHNLCRDAVLMAPCQSSKSTMCYGHLAAFLRGAPTEQKAQLWQTLGALLQKMLQGGKSQAPICWVSTDGRSVPWLHVRIDSRPKYIKHSPYRKERPLQNAPTSSRGKLHDSKKDEASCENEDGKMSADMSRHRIVKADAPHTAGDTRSAISHHANIRRQKVAAAAAAAAGALDAVNALLQDVKYSGELSHQDRALLWKAANLLHEQADFANGETHHRWP